MNNFRAERFIMQMRLFLCGAVLLLAGCGQQSDDQIAQEAYDAHRAIAARHVDILNSHDDKAVAKNAMRFGLDYRAEFGFWGGIFCDDYRDIAEIAPLHRAYFIINEDINTARGHMTKLKSRLLDTTSIYTNLQNLRDDLSYAQGVIREQKAYIEEARVLEQRRIQQAQLNEARRQTQALNDIACAQQKPCCCG